MCIQCLKQVGTELSNFKVKGKKNVIRSFRTLGRVSCVYLNDHVFGQRCYPLVCVFLVRMLSTCLNSPFVQLQTAEDRCLTTAYFPFLRPTLVCTGRPGANEGTVSHGPSPFCRKSGPSHLSQRGEGDWWMLEGDHGNPDGDK